MTPPVPKAGPGWDPALGGRGQLAVPNGNPCLRWPLPNNSAQEGPDRVGGVLRVAHMSRSLGTASMGPELRFGGGVDQGCMPGMPRQMRATLMIRPRPASP